MTGALECAFSIRRFRRDYEQTASRASAYLLKTKTDYACPRTARMVSGGSGDNSMARGICQPPLCRCGLALLTSWRCSFMDLNACWLSCLLYSTSIWGVGRALTAVASPPSYGGYAGGMGAAPARAPRGRALSSPPHYRQ